MKNKIKRLFAKFSNLFHIHQGDIVEYGNDNINKNLFVLQKLVNSTNFFYLYDYEE